jgi:hypothetical protein
MMMLPSAATIPDRRAAGQVRRRGGFRAENAKDRRGDAENGSLLRVLSSVLRVMLLQVSAGSMPVAENLSF